MLSKREKDTISVVVAKVSRRKNNPKHESRILELSLIKLSWLDEYYARKDIATSKRYILKKRSELKDIFTLHDLHNFAPQLETALAIRVVKPNLETRNVRGLCMRVWFTFPYIKYLFGASLYAFYQKSYIVS